MLFQTRTTHMETACFRCLHKQTSGNRTADNWKTDHHHTHTHSFSRYTWVSQLAHDSQPSVILILSILMGQAHRLHRAVPCPLTLTTMTISEGVLRQKFLQAGCSSCCPTNSIKELKTCQMTDQIIIIIVLIIIKISHNCSLHTSSPT